MANDGLEAIRQSRLYDDLMKEKEGSFLPYYSLHTKERIVKDTLMFEINQMLEALNYEFKDVCFSIEWLHNVDQSEDFHGADPDYNEEVFDEDEELSDDEDSTETFYICPLNEIDAKIFFGWKRVCNLGCEHITYRYYIMNMAKLHNLVSWFKAGTSLRSLVKDNIPDFFYDPEPWKNVT